METKFWTVYGLDGIFTNENEARQAWIEAGKPQQDGSSVWMSEHEGVETLRTVTLSHCLRMPRYID